MFSIDFSNNGDCPKASDLKERCQYEGKAFKSGVKEAFEIMRGILKGSYSSEIGCEEYERGYAQALTDLKEEIERQINE